MEQQSGPMGGRYPAEIAVLQDHPAWTYRDLTGDEPPADFIEEFVYRTIRERHWRAEQAARQAQLSFDA